MILSAHRAPLDTDRLERGAQLVDMIAPHEGLETDRAVSFRRIGGDTRGRDDEGGQLIGFHNCTARARSRSVNGSMPGVHDPGGHARPL